MYLFFVYGCVAAFPAGRMRIPKKRNTDSTHKVNTIPQTAPWKKLLDKIFYKNAQNYFDNVADPDLIEFAVYDMQAAQRRYEYMLKCVKRGEIDPWAATPALSQEQRNAKEHTKRIDKQLIWKMMHQGREDNRQEPSAQDIKQTPQT